MYFGPLLAGAQLQAGGESQTRAGVAPAAAWASPESLGLPGPAEAQAEPAFASFTAAVAEWTSSVVVVAVAACATFVAPNAVATPGPVNRDATAAAITFVAQDATAELEGEGGEPQYATANASFATFVVPVPAAYPEYPLKQQAEFVFSDIRYMGAYRCDNPSCNFSGITKLTNVLSDMKTDGVSWEGAYITIEGNSDKIDKRSVLKVLRLPTEDPVPLTRPGTDVASFASLPAVTLVKDLGRVLNGNYIRADGDDLPIYPITNVPSYEYKNVWWDSERQRLWVLYGAFYQEPGFRLAADWDEYIDLPAEADMDDRGAPCVVGLDFSTYNTTSYPEDPTKWWKPTLRGPYRWKSNDHTLFPNPRALNGQIQPAPAWLQSILDSYPDYYGTGPHWMMLSYDTNTIFKQSHGLGIAVAQVPQDTDEGCNTYSTDGKFFDYFPGAQPGNVAVPAALTARHLSFWPKSQSHMVDQYHKAYEVAHGWEPNYWRLNASGVPVWSKDHDDPEHELWDSPIWDATPHYPEQSIDLCCRSYMRVFPNGRLMYPTVHDYAGDSGDTFLTDLRTPGEYPNDGYGGFQSTPELEESTTFTNMNRYSMDGRLHYAAFFIDTPYRQGIMLFRNRCWGTRFYGEWNEPAAAYPGFEMIDGEPTQFDPADVGTPDIEWEDVELDASEVLTSDWIPCQPDPKDANCGRNIRITIEGDADSADEDADGGVWPIRLEFETNLHNQTDPVVFGRDSRVTGSELLVPDTYVPLQYDHTRGRYKLIADVPDNSAAGGVCISYRLKYYNNTTSAATVTIRAWKVYIPGNCNQGESVELVRSRFHPDHLPTELIAQIGSGGKGWNQELNWPTVARYDLADIREVAIASGEAGEPVGYTIEADEEAGTVETYRPRDEDGVLVPDGIYGHPWPSLGYRMTSYGGGANSFPYFGYHDTTAKRLYVVQCSATPDKGLINVWDTSALFEPAFAVAVAPCATFVVPEATATPGPVGRDGVAPSTTWTMPDAYATRGAPPATIAYQTYSYQSREGTTDPVSWTHTVTAAPKGVIVFTSNYTSSTDYVSGVTYGGTALTKIAEAYDSAGEPTRVQAWFLGSGVYTTSTTVQVDFTSETDEDYDLLCVTVTANGDVSVEDYETLSESQANPQVTLETSDKTCLTIGCLASGMGVYENFTPLSGMTLITYVDSGAELRRWDMQTTASTADFTYGFTVSNDDTALVALALTATVGGTWPDPSPLLQSSEAIALTASATFVVPTATATPGPITATAVAPCITWGVCYAKSPPDDDSWFYETETWD